MSQFSLVAQFLVLLSLAVIPAARAQSNSEAAQFIGTWRLVSIEGAGRGTDPADRPTGFIVYDKTGHVSVQIAYNSNRHPFAAGRYAGTTEEKTGGFDSYTAYYGTFSVDSATGIVIHHIEGSLNPSYVGNDFVRYYELHGNRTVLHIADDGKGGRLPLKETTRRLIWERIEPQ